MINFDNYANENKIRHNSSWPYLPNDSYRILIIAGSGSGKKCVIEFNKQSVRYW